MHPTHPEFATYHAGQRIAWLLEEAEHHRQVGQARRARRQQRQRRRLTRTLRAIAARAVHQPAGAQ
jgi:hypothetical protein